jgi:hypothetical protein
MAFQTPTSVNDIPMPLALYEAQVLSDVIQNSTIEPQYRTAGDAGRHTGPFSFHIQGTDDYIDLNNTVLEVTGHFTGQRPADPNAAPAIPALPVDDANLHFSFVNALGHAFIAGCDIKLNNKAVSTGDQNYGYKTVMEILLNYGKEAQETYFASCGWSKDVYGHMDSVDPAQNTALAVRRSRAHNRSSIHFLLKIHSPLFQMGKVLLNQVNVDVTFTRHPESQFYLMHGADGGNYRFEMDEAILHVQKLQPTPEYCAGIERMLRDEDVPVTYIVNQPKLNVLSIPVGQTNYVNSNLFQGAVPRRIIVAMVATTAYNGISNANPFNFQHFNLREIGLYRNGIPYPRPVTKVNFANKDYTYAYHQFMASIQAAYNRHVPNISIEEWAQGTTLFSWDMSPDQYGGEDPLTLAHRPANIRLTMQFEQATAVPITLLVYYEQDLRIQIDYSRTVSVETL